MAEEEKRELARPETFIFWKEGEAQRKWKWIPNTREAVSAAIGDGAMFRTWCAFSHHPDDDGPEPVRYGAMPIDADDKDHPENALQELRRLCLYYLPEKYSIDPWDMRFFCSGGKGFHAEIPARFFSLQNGHPYLPEIYRKLATSWVDALKLATIDLSMYAMGKGKMWRLANIKRPNGRYKVPIDCDSFAYCSPEVLWAMSDQTGRL